MFGGFSFATSSEGEKVQAVGKRAKCGYFSPLIGWYWSNEVKCRKQMEHPSS
jgi:hypothetical protein